MRPSEKDPSKPQTHTQKQKQRRNRRTIGFMPLEPRVMYDGAAAASAAVAHHHADHHDIANGSGMPGGGGSPGGGVPGANGAAPSANGAPASGAGEWSYHGSSNGHWSGEQGSVGGIAGDKAPGTGPAPTVPSIVSDQSGTPGNNEAGKTTSLTADQSSGGNASNPIPTVTTWVKDPTEIVFIDEQAPDYQLLASGVKSGIEVVELNPNSDGVQQIADFLAAHPDPNLTTIDIVAHGADGVVQLGTTLLSSSTIDDYQTQLAAIGNAMQPGGNIQIYGCDVAQDFNGDLFLVQLSQATGGKNVDASSGLVGAAALGGSWTLNVDLGGAPTANPFTDATLESYADVLPDEIFVTSTVPIGVTDASTGTSNTTATLTSIGSPLIEPTYIAVDPAHNVYYVIDTENEAEVAEQQAIYVGAITGTLADGNKVDKIFSVPAVDFDILAGMALNPATNTLYFGQTGDFEYNPSSPNAHTLDQISGVFSLNLNDLNLSSPSGPGTLSETLVAYGPDLGVLAGLTLDTVNNEVYFIDDSSGNDAANTASFTPPLPNTTATNNIYEASLIGGPNQATSILQLADAAPAANDEPTGYTQGFLNGIAYDSANQTLYFTTWDENDSSFLGTGVNNVYAASVPAPGDQITLPSPLYTNSAIAQPFDVKVDVAAGQLYIYDHDTVSDNFGHSEEGSIVQASISGGAVTTLFAPAVRSPEPMLQGLALDVAPVVTASGTTTTYDEGGSADQIDSGLTVATPSNPGENLNGATVSISSGFATGDSLNFSTQNGITGVFSGSTLTLSGVASVADYQTALDSVTFTSTAASATARTIHFSVTDGVLTSNTATDAVDVVLLPTIAGTGNTADFWQSLNAAATLDGALTVSDPNSANITSATATISSGFLSGDTLSIPAADLTSGKITGTNISFSVSGNQLTLSGSDTAAHYQQALRDVTYNFSGDPTNAGADRSRTITWSVTDAGNLTSAAGSTTALDVFALPIVTTGSATTPTETSISGAVTADSTLSITDYNGTTIHNASVQITSGDVSTDTLTINGTTSGTITGITYSFTGSTLTLTGTASVANYAAVLDDVKFDAVSPNSGPRVLTWEVNDQAGGNTNNSAPVTTNVNVSFGPQVAAGATATFNGGGSPVALDAGLTVTDPSSTTLASATVSITSGFLSGDTLNFTNQNGITGSYDAVHGILTLTGTSSLAHYQTALDSIAYDFTPGGDPTGGGGDTSRTISWTVNDGTNSNTPATSTLDTVHTAPMVVTAGTATFTGGGSPVVLDSGVELSDVDSDGTLASATVSIASGYTVGDTLNFTNVNPTIEGNISVSSDAGGVLVLTSSGATATVAQWQTALEAVTYSFSPSNGDPTGGGGDTSRTIDWVVNDGSTSNGSSNSSSESAPTSTLDTVHVAPTVTTGGTVTFDGGGSPVTLDGTATVSDVDSAGNLTGATVKISSGLLSGDTLDFTNQNGISGSYDSATGTLTLTGTATLAHYQTALDSITYSFTPSNGDPTSNGSDTARTISWTVTDGSTSNGTSNTATSTLDTVHVAPTVTAGGTATFDGGGSPVALDGTLTVSDPDSGGNLTGATVKISSGLLSGDTLDFTNQNGISGSYDAVNGILTLTGTATVANYQTALDSMTFSFSPSNGDPTDGGGNTTRTISWTVTDGLASNGTSNTSTSTLDTVHVAPTVTAGGTATFDGGGSPVTLDGTLTVSDPDGAGDLTGATVTISSGLQSGDALNFTNQNGITGSYDGTTGILTLTGTTTVANYQTALDSITYSFSPTNADPTGGAGDTSRTISWTVTDASTSNGTSTTATSTLDVVHVAPTVTAGGTATFDGGGSPVTLDGTLTLSDPDSAGNLTGATVKISSGLLSGDSLNFTTQNGISGSYDSATGLLTLTGTASVANYQTALDSVTYSFSPTNGDPTNGGIDTGRTVSWSVTDGSTSNGASNTGTSTLDTVHVAPTVTAGATATFEVSGPAVAADNTLTVSDVDSAGNVTAATVKISSGFVSGDALNFTNQNGITGSYDTATGMLNLIGTSSVANYQTALDSITFSSTVATAGTRTLTWNVDDGSTTHGTSANETSTVDVVLGPQITAGATAIFTGGGSPVTLDGALTVTDTVHTTLASATVSISTGFLTGDELNFTNQNGITGSYDSGTGILTLTGTSSVSNYQTALDSITYSFSPSNGDPTNLGVDASRTVSWSGNDGTATSDAVTSTVGTVHVAPTVTAGALVQFTGGSTTPVTLDSALTVSDVDSNGNLTEAQVSIAGGFLTGDTLNFTNQNGITGTYDAATFTLTLTGTSSVSNYQTALESVTYSFSPSNGDPSSNGFDFRLINWVVSDGSTSNGSGGDTSLVEVNHVPPTVTSGGTVTFDGGGSPVTLDSTLTLSDPDSSGNLTSATVSVSSGFISGDELNFTNQNGISGSYDAVHGILTLTGTSSIADYQLALQSVTYSFSPSNGDPTNGGGDTSRTISWAANDGNPFSGISNTGTSTLDTVHVAPTVTSGGTVTFTGGGGPVDLDSTLTVSDTDSSGQLSGATVSVSSGFISGDTLNFTNQAGITGSYDAVHGILTLSGTATIAQYQAALESISYSFSPSNGDPTNGETDTSRTISWTVTDGSTCNGTSNTGTSTLDTTHTPPTVIAGASAVFDGGGSPVILDGTLTVTDPDSFGNLSSAFVTINSGFVSGDTLNFTNQNGITGSYDAAHGQLTLTGTASVADYQTALDSVTYSFSPANGDPTHGGGATSRIIAWTADDGESSATGQSTLTVVHVAPTVTAGGTATFDGGSSPVTLDGTATVSDVDSNGNLASATVSISSNFLSGDTLNFTNQNGITGSYDAVHGILTLTGTSSVADYQTALDSITYSFSPSNGDPTNAGVDASRTISWTVTDGSTSNGTSNTATSTLDTVHVAPVVTAGATTTFEIFGPAVAADNALTLTDVDSNGNLASATVSISSNFQSGDSLNFTNQNGITGSYDAVHGILTLTGTSSVADYQTALDSITFSSAVPFMGTRTLNWTVTDGSASNGTSNTGTSTIDLVVGPQITAGGTATFNGGSTTPATIDGALTVSETAQADLTGASVSITTGFISGDVLDFTNQAGITGSYDAVHGVLTLTGTSTVSNYQTALDSISYSFSPSNADPTNGGGDTSRTISWTGTDSVATSTAVTSSLTVNHTAPTVTGIVLTGFTGGGPAVTLDGELAVSDPDSGGNLTGATVSISTGFISGDLLNFTNQNGITGSYDAVHGILTLTGTSSVSNYQTALDSVTYGFSPSNGDPTNGGSDLSRHIEWSVTDGSSGNGTGTEISYLEVFHVAPTVTAGGTATFDGGGSAVTLDGTLTASDVDSNGNLAGATVSIGTGFTAGDLLNFTNQNGISGSYDAVHGILTLSGTSSVTNYQAALDSITYSFNPVNGDPTAGGGDTTRTISWTVTDGNTNNGTSNTATSTLDVVHIAPTVTAGGTATFDGGGSPVTLDGALSLTDVDSSGQLTSATVQITSGLQLGDDLSATNHALSTIYNSSTGELVISGTASIATYQSVLESITYSFNPANGDPTNGGGDTARTITWTVSDGSTSNGTSAASTSTLDVVHVAPTVTAGATVTLSQNSTSTQSAIVLDSALTLADPDSNGLLTGATVSISAGFLNNSLNTDVLSFTAQNGITGSYDAVHGVLTLSGTATVGQYQTALESITFNSIGPNPTNDGADLTRTISWTVTDGNTSNGHATATSTVDVQAFPTVVAGASVNYQAGLFSEPVKLDASVGVYDGTNITSATVSLGTGFQIGDILLASTSGTSIHALYNPLTGVMTLSGTDTPQHYDQVMQSITFSSAQLNNGTVTVDWHVTDQNNLTSKTQTSDVHVKSALFPVIGNLTNNPVLPPQGPHSGYDNFSPTFITYSNDNGGPSFGDGQSVIPLHADVTINVADNGAVDFNAPLGVLEASLDGDVVSITATLPDGQPLPDWLHFNVETGKFAGIVPDYSTGTGSLPQDGGDTGGHNTFPDKLTVEVVATDAKGDIAIIDFTINLKPDNGTHHGWNLPRDLRNLAPIELPHQHAQFLPQHGLPGPLLAAGGGHDHGAGHALAGRAGLSQQLAGHGLHGMHADRMALLESLRHATAAHS